MAARRNRAERSAKPANQRGAARLAAVQALYQMDLSGATLPEVIAEFETYRLGKEVDGDQYRDADAAFFRDIVAGVVRDQKTLDPAIDRDARRRAGRSRASTRRCAPSCAPAPSSWPSRADVPARVVISEYVDVAKAFFEDDAPGMVNAVLDALARELRAGRVRPAGRAARRRDGGEAEEAPRRVRADRALFPAAGRRCRRLRR